MTRELRYRIRLMSPLSSGTGVSGRGLDELVPRHPDGYPMVVSATIKGATRDALVRSGLDTRDLGTEDGDGGSVWFSDAKPVEALRSRRLVGTRSRTQLGVGRTAKVGSLRVFEVIEPVTAPDMAPTVFEGVVRLLPGRTDAAALALVESGLAQLSSLGGGTNRGFGRVQVATNGRSNG